MTAAALTRTDRRTTAVVVACGCLAIAYKPFGPAATATLALVALAGMVMPVDGRAMAERRHAEPRAWMLAALLGVVAFAAARALAVPLGPRATIAGVVGLALAAIFEEMFFRGFCYTAVAARAGHVAAIAISSMLFAVVHVPSYGWKVVPIDLAAGLLLGWQRMVTGTWTASAVTHAAANLMQLGYAL